MVDHHCATVLGVQTHALASVSSWEDLERWAAVMLAIMEEHGARGGCPIGTLASALADTDEELRTSLSEAFRAWSDVIRGALLRLRAQATLPPCWRRIRGYRRSGGVAQLANERR